MIRMISIGRVEVGNVAVKGLGCDSTKKKKSSVAGFGFRRDRAKHEHHADRFAAMSVRFRSNAKDRVAK